MARNVAHIFRCIADMIVLAVLLNILFNLLNVRWDVTAARSHTMSAETRDFLQTIREPVRMTVFFNGTPPRYLKDLLDRYQDLSGGKITAEIIDPLVNIGYAAGFGTMIDKNETKVFLRSGSKSSDVDFTGEDLTEDLVNYGLLRLNRAAKTACFTSGHGEYQLDSDEPEGLKKFQKRLQQQNIGSRDIILQTQTVVPSSCDALVIAGPRKHFSVEDEDKVLNYLRGGGDALILIENVIVTTPEIPLTAEQQDLNPSLDRILSAWGLRAGRDIIVDLSSHISGDPGTPATRNYMKHPSLLKDLDYTFYVRPRSLSMLADRRKEIKLAPFVLSSSPKTSWAESNRTLQVKFNEGEDVPGPVTLSYVAWGPRPQPDASDTRLMVFTDADFLSNAFIDQFSNGQMAMNVMNWLVDADFQAGLSSRNTDHKTQRLDLTSAQKIPVLAGLLLLPLVILASGIFVWIRRR